MGGDEYFMVKEQQLIGIQFEGELLRSVARRHRIAIGVEENVAAAIGTDRSHDGTVIRQHRQGLEPGLLRGKQVEGVAVGFTMHQDVGHGVPPHNAAILTMAL